MGALSPPMGVLLLGRFKTIVKLSRGAGGRLSGAWPGENFTLGACSALGVGALSWRRRGGLGSRGSSSEGPSLPRRGVLLECSLSALGGGFLGHLVPLTELGCSSSATLSQPWPGSILGALLRGCFLPRVVRLSLWGEFLIRGSRALWGGLLLLGCFVSAWGGVVSLGFCISVSQGFYRTFCG